MAQNCRTRSASPGGAPSAIRRRRSSRYALSLQIAPESDGNDLKHDLRHKAPKTVNNVLSVLNTMLKKAVEWDALATMPCTIKLLKVGEGSMDFYDFDTLRRFARPKALGVITCGAARGIPLLPADCRTVIPAHKFVIGPNVRKVMTLPIRRLARSAHGPFRKLAEVTLMLTITIVWAVLAAAVAISNSGR